MKSLALALLVFGFAGVASAQFDECVQPSLIPADVFETIVEEAGFDFGDLEENVCQQIVNKGISTCKAQVKAAAKCFKRSGSGTRDIGVKQCSQLDQPDKNDCKSFFNEEKQLLFQEVDSDRDLGIELCEGDFADDLATACALGVKV